MAQRLFIQIDTIRGETTDAFHRDEIEVLDWSWINIQNTSIDSASGPIHTGLVPPSICFTHYIDRATPELMQKSLTKERLKKAILSAQLQQSDMSRPIDFFKLTLEEVFIKSTEQTGEAASNRMKEKVTLICRKVIEEYTRISSTGGSSETVRKGFDFAKNQPL